jgi:hypothetical protein
MSRSIWRPRVPRRSLVVGGTSVLPQCGHTYRPDAGARTNTPEAAAEQFAVFTQRPGKLGIPNPEKTHPVAERVYRPKLDQVMS